MLELEEFIGYISVIVLYDSVNKSVFGLEIKFFMTPVCSIGFLIRNFSDNHQNRFL